jgi:hypothetical protein
MVLDPVKGIGSLRGMSLSGEVMLLGRLSRSGGKMLVIGIVELAVMAVLRV